MLIKNGRWLSPEGNFIASDLHIKNGKIVNLSAFKSSDRNDSVYNAKDLLILPGAIDPHVHFREPGQMYKEGIDSGSRAALRGGVTTVLDMPNNKPPCSTAKRLQKKKELFRRKCHVNWGIIYHTSAHNKDQVQGDITSAKIYMAKSSALPAITSLETLKDLFSKFPMISIHAEDETEFDTTLNRSPWHHENRPRKAVISALQKIEKALQTANLTKPPRIVICHMSTVDEVEWIGGMKKTGFDIWGETCPHYLFFTQEDYLKKGTVFQVNPPIRSKEDRDRLREAISTGMIDFIGTDHAPHARAEKNSTKPPSGIAAIEWLVPQMLHFIDAGIIGWQRFHELICSRAAKCYSIKKRDGIKTGNFADLIFVKKKVPDSQKKKIQTKVGINLYEEFDFQWKVVGSMVNGILKFEGHKFYEEIKGREV